MIVRPTPTKLQPAHSPPPHPRRRANSTSATLAPKLPRPPSPPFPLPHSPLLHLQPPPSSSSRPSTSPAPPLLPLSTNNNPPAAKSQSPPPPAPAPALASPPAKRKLFRLKRPSSSSADTRPAPPGAARARASLQHYGFMQGAMGMSIVDPVAAVPPPRPPRNPARNTGPGPGSRPSSSSGGGPHPPLPMRAPRAHAAGSTGGDGREIKATAAAMGMANANATAKAKARGAGEAAADWEFPLPRGSEFPLQRKKSRTRTYAASRVAQDESARSDVPFSTVDRTILEELRQKIRAREGQFVTRSGRKYHAFPAADVPYPRSYDRHLVDLDVWDNLWQLQLGGSLTMHVFERPPARVLDLGCGTGTWILNAAREWKDSHFVGMDVVPLHPDLLQVGCFDLAARITWVQGNFLENLPFPNEEFDYVRLTRVSRGVPEDKWDALFEEITRVMKPGGAFEMWEEDLHFPARRNREPVQIIDEPDPEPSMMRPPTPPRTDSSHSSEQLPPPALRSPIAHSYSLDDITRVDQRPALFAGADAPAPDAPDDADADAAQRPPMLFRSLDRPPMNPHDHSLLETIYDEMHAARFINLEPVSTIANLLPLHFVDVRAPPPIVVAFPPPPIPPVLDEGSPAPTQRQMRVLDDTPYGDAPPQADGLAALGAFAPSQGSSVLHARDMADSPFVVVDTARFAGVSPSAFRRRRPLSPGRPDSPLPPPPLPLPPNSPSLPPHGPPTNTNGTGKPAKQPGRNTLPNQTINFDTRTLNLLLALRVQEVLGCAEPMWDWVVDFQETVVRAARARRQTPAQTAERARRPRRRHAQEDALMGLTRADFDALLRRFEMDMKTRMFLAPAVEERLGWPAYAVSANEEREAFEAMCAAWAGYERRQAAAAGARPPANGSTTTFSRSTRSPSPPPLLPTPRHSMVSDGEDGTGAGAHARAHGNGNGDAGGARTMRRHALHAKSQPQIPIPIPILAGAAGGFRGGQGRRKSAPEKPGRAPSRPGTAGTVGSTGSVLSSSEGEQELPPSSRTGRIFVAWKAAAGGAGGST